MHLSIPLQRNLYALSLTIVFSIGCVSCITTERESAPTQIQTHEQCELPKQRYSWPIKNPPKLIWLSLDSLNQAGLEEIVGQLKNPHPRGLKWILQTQNKNPQLTIHEPTITSSSHISTITCSSAGTHGIYANTQWNGSKMVSGFGAPFETETFATTLKKSGLRVVTAAYPALDNSEEGRLVSEGFSYGESTGRSQLHAWNPGQPMIHSWKDAQGNLIEELSFKGNDLAETQNFSCKVNRCVFEKSAVTDLIDVTILSPQRRLRAYVQQLPRDKKQVYISPLSANNSFPKETRNKKEKCGAIFSPGKDYSLASFGADHLIRGFEHRLNFFDWNWAYYLPSTNADVLFLYLEDIDALRHQYSGDLAARDSVALHYQRVDEVVGNLIASLPASTNVVVLGDHGMSTVSRELNIRKILPEQALRESNIVTSGGTLMLYGSKNQSRDLSALPDGSEQTWLQHAQMQLMRFRLHDSKEPVFSKIYIKGTDAMKKAGLAHQNAPFLIAFAHDTYALQNSLTDELILGDINNSEKPPPRPRGQHGHARESSRMKTFLAGWGPVIDKIHLGDVKSNIDLVPTLGKAFSWQIPPQCRSK